MMVMLTLGIYLQLLVALLLAVAGLVLLYKNTHYASVDAGAFMSYSNMMKKGIFFEKNYVHDYENDDVKFKCSNQCVKHLTFKEVFQDRIPGYFYNISINLMKLFPHPVRFKATQMMNIIFYGLFIGSLMVFLHQVFERTDVNAPLTCGAALSCSLLLACRSKLLVTVMFIYTEIVNFFLFGLILLVADRIEAAPTIYWAMTLGALTGLCFRNRQTDIFLLPSGLGYLWMIGTPWEFPAMLTLGFCLINIDLFVVQLRWRMPAFHYLFSILSSQNVLSTNLKKNIGENASRHHWRLVLNMFNPYAPDNFFISMGVQLWLLPVSALIFLSHGLPSRSLLFVVLVAAVNFTALLFVRTEDYGESLFGGRPAYYMFICGSLLNFTAFYVCCRQGEWLYWGLYGPAWGGYLLHQLYKVLGYHFSDSISEKRLHDHRKDPEPYRQVARDFLMQVERPAVIMGVHLIMGIPLNFFAWSKDLRVVELRVRADDERIRCLIDAYGVTHILLTPHDFPLDRDCSLLKPELGPLLRDRLIPRKLSSQVTVFEVIRKGSPAAQFSTVEGTA